MNLSRYRLILAAVIVALIGTMGHAFIGREMPPSVSACFVLMALAWASIPTDKP